MLKQQFQAPTVFSTLIFRTPDPDGCTEVRAAENDNCPTLLVFLLSFCVTALVAYSNMRRLPRLESEQKSGAILDNNHFPRP